MSIKKHVNLFIMLKLITEEDGTVQLIDLLNLTIQNGMKSVN